jgi:hypothetical protein
MYIINDEFVLLENRLLLEKKYMKSDCLDGMHAVTIAHLSDSFLPEDFFLFLKQASDTLFDTYRFHLIDPTNIQLIDTYKDNIRLCIHSKTAISERLLNHYKILRDELQKNVSTKRAQWIVDARFDHHLIVYSKRGDNERKNVL